MKQIIVESSLEAALTAEKQQVILCNAAGEVLGFYSPLPKPTPLTDLQLEPPLTIEETKELRKHRTGRPLEEILREFNL